MDDKNGFVITTRDKVLRAWENSTELVRDFQTYSQEIKGDKQVAGIFAEFAEDEAMHAAKFLELLKTYDTK